MKQYPLMNTHLDSSTICALSTPAGSGALAIVRVSGPEAITLCDRFFQPRSGVSLTERRSHTATFGRLVRDGELLDEAVATVFRAPHSFTGEDTVELSCHGSTFIQQRLLEWLIDGGARAAAPGEFTRRAFLNGRMDLSQAEAVADLIASTSAGMHRVAMNQMRGGFSDELATLRTQLLEFASLVELELDFGDHEELEFADRTRLRELAERIARRIDTLAASFAAGNALKHGLPVAIIGRPNVGKSTLVNRVLGRREAVVQDTPGVTRDRVSYPAEWAGRRFTIVDTGGWEVDVAGLDAAVATQAEVAVEMADAVLLVVDAQVGITETDARVVRMLRRSGKPVVLAANKVDSPAQEGDAAALWNLGLGEPFPVVGPVPGGEGGFQQCAAQLVPGHPVGDDVQHLGGGEAELSDRLEQALLGAEVVADQGVVHVRVAGDRPQGRPGVAVFGEARLGRSEDAVLAIGRSCGTPRSFIHHS